MSGAALVAWPVAVGQAAPLPAGKLPSPAVLRAAMERQGDLVYSRERAESNLGSDAVDFYRERFGVSTAVARHRLGTQGMVPDLLTVLERRTGLALASLRFDNADGNWVVAVTPGTDEAPVRRVLTDLGLGEDSRIETHAYTDHALEEAGRKLRLRYGNDTARLGVLGGGVRNGKLVVQVRQDAPASSVEEVVQVAGKEVGDAVEVDRVDPSTLPQTQTTCTFPNCDSIIAGSAVYNSGTWAGTLGFLAVGSTYYQMVAGHMFHSTTTPWGICWGGPCPDQGVEVAGYNGGATSGTADGDGGIFQPQGISYPLGMGYANWATSSITNLYGSESTNSANGTSICHNGATTHQKCGTTTMSSWTPTSAISGRWYKNMVLNDACAQQGDSGGPWTQAAAPVASGIQSLGNVLGSCTAQSAFEPVNHIESRYGVAVAHF